MTCNDDLGLAAQALVDAIHGGVEAFLADGQCQIAARLLQDAADGVGGAAQIAGDGVGVVQCDELAVDFIHVGQQFFAAFEPSLAHAVENVAAQLANRLAQPIEVRRPFHAKHIGGRGRLALHQRAGEGGLGVFLLRVGHESCVENILVLAQVERHIPQQAASLGQLPGRLVEFTTVSSANGIGAEPNRGARLGQGALTSGKLGRKILLRCSTNGLEIRHRFRLLSADLSAGLPHLVCYQLVYTSPRPLSNHWSTLPA